MKKKVVFYSFIALFTAVFIFFAIHFKEWRLILIWVGFLIITLFNDEAIDFNIFGVPKSMNKWKYAYSICSFVFSFILIFGFQYFRENDFVMSSWFLALYLIDCLAIRMAIKKMAAAKKRVDAENESE